MTVTLFDGPDGTGKTGYAEWFARQRGSTFLRLEPDHDFGELDGEVIERVSATFNQTLVQLDEQGVDVVVDRGPVSSIVYSHLFDRDRPVHAWNALRDLDPYIVYLRCDPRELEIRYEDEKFDDVGAIAQKYDEVMQNLRGEYEMVTVDTSSGAPNVLDDVAFDWFVNSEVKPCDE